MEVSGIGYSDTRLLMKKRILMICISVLILTLFIPVHRLRLIEVETGNVIYSFPITNGEKFTVCFIHSVEQTPWHEIYSIENNKDIYLKETIFSSFGAGLPATTEYNFSMEEDGMHITNYERKMDPLIYKVGAVVADHTVTVGNKKIHLNKITEPSNSVIFKAEKMSLYRHLLKGGLNNG